jgi:NAD(P)-dependent dehydrogenase (short-subunit alcohol dehydrogenase family)
MPNGTTMGAVVVTGASTGIGRATALHLDDLGYDVFAGVRRPEDADSLKADATGSLQPLTLDVTDEASLAKAAEEVAQAVGNRGLVGLVNNAGVATGGPLEILPLDELRRQLEVNVVGQVAATQAFLPLLRGARGRVVNMGSVGALAPAPMTGAYAASKAAMERVTDVLRQELHPWGIWVAIIEPGAIKTPIWDKGASDASGLIDRLPPAQVDLYRRSIDSGLELAAKTGARGSPPEKVARKVAHALGARRPRARYMVGTDARMQASLARLLPERLYDAVIRRVVGA